MRPRQSDAHRGAARHAHAADFFLVVTLQGKHSREWPFYQKWRASMGRPHVRPVCFAVHSGYCQSRTPSVPSGPEADSIRALIDTDRAKVFRRFADPGDLGGQTFRFRPRDWNEKALTVNAVRAFSFGLSSSSSCGKALCPAAAFRRPLPVANAASARSASGYPSLRPFYSQGRPRWAHPCRNRNAP